MAPNSHRADFHTSHDQLAQRQSHQLLVNISTWHVGPHNNHPPVPGPSAAMLQRPGPPAQRQLSSAPYAGADVYVNDQSTHAIWPAPNLYRPGWDHGLPDDTFASRPSTQYSDAEADPSVPQPPPTFSRQYATSRVHDAQLSQQQSGGFQGPDEQRELHHSSTEYAAPSMNASQYHPNTQRSAPVARLLNYPLQPNGPIHIAHQPMIQQASIGWHEPMADLPPAPHNHYTQSHTSVALPSSGVLSNAPGVSSLSWGDMNGNAAGAVHLTYQRQPHIDPEWGFVQASSSDTRYSHSHHVPLSQISPTESSPPDHAGPLRHRSNKAPTRPRQTKTKVASAYIPRQQKVKISKRKGPLEDHCKAKAHKMRKTRVCVRCKMYKAGCDEGDPCEKCAKTMGSARSFLEPCFRDSIEDMGLVRHCNGRCNQAEADFLKYVWQESSPILQMEILWFLPGKQQPIQMAQPLRLRYRPFRPEAADPNTTKSVWKNTEEAVISLSHAPYAVFDTTALQPDVESYFFANLPSMERWIYHRIGRDDIALLTYQEAFRLRNNGSTLNAALHLQCLSIMSQGYGAVHSRGIPGIETVDFGALGHADYEAYDRTGRDQILPAAMNHQMDVAFVKLLRRLEHECHKLLHNQVFKEKIKPWYELHLTFFILCWNLGYISQGATKYLQSKRGIIISSVISQQIRKWEYTYEVILKYWRSVLRGFVPFKLARENQEELHENGQLPDNEAFRYMLRAIEVWDRTGVDRHKPPLTGLSSSLNSMENRYISELFKIAGA